MIDTLFTLAAAADPGSANPVTILFGKFGVQPQLILAQAINFSVVAFVLWRFAFKPVMATIEERQKKIADGLQYAEEMKARLEDAEKQHAETLKKASQEAQALLQEARANAKAFEDKKMQEVTARAEAILKKAEEAIALEKQQMLNEVRQEVARLVVLTSGKVLSRELTAEERNRFSEASARELTANN